LDPSNRGIASCARTIFHATSRGASGGSRDYFPARNSAALEFLERERERERERENVVEEKEREEERKREK